jgi:hypothetical protein
MRVLRADLALCLDPVWPVDKEWIGGAATIGLAFPPFERRVASERPTPRVVVEMSWSAEFV